MKNSQVREAIIRERVEKEVAVMKYLDPQKAILEQEESPQRRDSRTQWPQYSKREFKCVCVCVCACACVCDLS